jgi:hypothetical protein
MLPAISGAETKTFDTMFWKGITERQLVSNKTVPAKGSIGVFWQVYKDIRVLGPENIQNEKVNKLYPRNPDDGKVITSVNAKALKAFYEWANQTTEPLFFIKKGTQPLWLCRKTGTYYYEDKAEDPYWYPHRIPFEFVRPVTESEGVKRMGIGMNTMIWIECELPKQEPPTVVEMPPKKKGVATVIPAPPAPAPAPVKAKPGRKPKAKPVAITKPAEPVITVEPVTQETITATYVESEEDPLEVEVIKVQTFTVDGKEYYRDPLKNKLYKRLANGGVGPYVGRFSNKGQQLHEEIEDSDREDDI